MAKNDDTVEALLAFGFIAAIGCGLYMVVKSFAGFGKGNQIEEGDLLEAVETEEVQEVVEVQNLDVCADCGKINPKRCSNRKCRVCLACFDGGYCGVCRRCSNCTDGLGRYRNSECSACC